MTEIIRGALLRMHRKRQSDKPISDALDVSEAFVSNTVKADRAGGLHEMPSVLCTGWNFIQHRNT